MMKEERGRRKGEQEIRVSEYQENKECNRRDIGYARQAMNDEKQRVKLVLSKVEGSQISAIAEPL